MNDTENIRREMVSEINSPDFDLPEKTWTTTEMQSEFIPLGFAAPFIIVERKNDRKKGSLEFKHSPRVYFNWQEDK